jgi:hypothetical protein
MDPATLSRTLQELEGERWPAPADEESYLVREAHRLRTVPLGALTVEDLRLLLGQRIGVEWLMPLALDKLRTDPLAAGDFYAGDLLTAVLRTDAAYWASHADQRSALREVRIALGSSGDGPGFDLESLKWPDVE